jgi:hypothetical protein
MINHLSWPCGSSVNDGIPDVEAHISYDMFECAVSDLRLSGRGSLMVKLDLKDAFRHVPIRAADHHHMGMFWNGEFYYAIVLMFGLRSAPYIFNLFSEALHCIISHHIPARLCHYLDDFWLVFRPGTDPAIARAAVEWILALGEELGLHFQGEKMFWPCSLLDFLGLDLDSDAMEA